MFLVAVHAYHFVSVLPVVVFLLIVAFVTAVVLIAAGWYHPVSYVGEVLAFVGYVDLPLAHHAYLFYKLFRVA